MLVGCGNNAIVVTSIASDQESFTVNVSPSVVPIYPALVECGFNIEGAHALFYDGLSQNTSVEDRDVLIQLGEAEETPGFAAVLGFEEIVVVVHPSNPVDSLTLRQQQSLFSGKHHTWDIVGGNEEPVTVWGMLQGDESMQLFQQDGLQGWLLTVNGRLAPSASAMLEAILGDPTGIGFLPRAWVTEDVKVIENGLIVPVLALTAGEPDGPVREFLGCLQSGTGKPMIEEVYFSQP